VPTLFLVNGEGEIIYTQLLRQKRFERASQQSYAKCCIASRFSWDQFDGTGNQARCTSRHLETLGGRQNRSDRNLYAKQGARASRIALADERLRP